MSSHETPADKELAQRLLDGRQSEAALEVQRGAVRLLSQLGLSCVTELPLPNGRRADIIAISTGGDIWIVEVKSCLADFRADQKWPEYREFCDRLLFAVKPDFPLDVLDPSTGLILADRYGGEILREPAETRLAPARRKAMTLRIARFAAYRLSLAMDPALASLLNARVET